MRLGAIVAVVLLQVVAPRDPAWAQLGKRPTPGYDIAAVYDRVTDSTRITFTLKEGSRPFGLGSRVWLDLAFAYPGQRLAAPPAAVWVTLESSTTARKGSWAFAGPRPLHVTSDGSFHLQLAPGGYSRRVVRSGDPQFQDAISYTLTPEQVALAAAQPQLDLKAGNARMRLAADGMEMIREAVRRMSVPASD